MIASFRLTTALFASMLCVASAAHADDSAKTKGLEIAKAAKTRDEGFGSYRSEAKMILRDRSGTANVRDFTALALEVPGDGDHTSIEFQTPLDVRWEVETTRIVRAEETVQRTKWHESPVGCAIQLVLLRPDPVRFRTWLDDFPEVPPGTWWTAATLCGLLHGYRGLHPEFRGDAVQRRLLALHAIASSGAGHSFAALGGPRERLVISESPRGVGFRWGGLEFATKPETARRKWMQLDLKVVVNERAAEDVARSCKWSCFEREMRLANAEVTFESDKAPEIIHGIATTLRFHGEARAKLPADTVIRERLDPDLFRRCLLVEGGRVPPPPGTRVEEQRDVKPRLAPSVPREPGRIETPSSRLDEAPRIPGLIYRPGFVGSAEAERLMAEIEREEWRKDLSRRVQHHGWRYDYKVRKVTDEMRLGPLPDWAQRLAERLHSEGLVPHVPDQVIVNEYVRKQGISEHVDCVPCFADGIVMISLLESWEMVFRRRDVTKRLLLEANSVAVLTREARYEWTHEIPSRVKEPSGLRRQRRVSVTFRKVLLPAN